MGDILIIAILIIAAIILFLAELFLVPGISIAGILAGGCAIFANYYAFANLGTSAGFITLLVTAIACIGSGAVILVPRFDIVCRAACDCRGNADGRRI